MDGLRLGQGGVRGVGNMTAQARLDTLEAIIDVMLQEAENGTLEQAAAEIRRRASVTCPCATQQSREGV